MRRTNWKTVSTLVTMIAVAGCSESTVTPAASVAATSAQFAPSGRIAPSLNLNTSPNSSGTIRVGPQGGVYLIGNSAVVFPRGSVCEPSTANGYGMDKWDAPCTPLTTTLTIPYVTSSTGGRTSVDFGTPLRFVPSNNPAQWVLIYMYTPGAAHAQGNLDRYTIFYAPTLNGPVYDETGSDSSLRTYVDTRLGISMRRIKHFSGWTVYGVACDPATSLDPTCHDDGGFTPPANNP